MPRKQSRGAPAARPDLKGAAASCTDEKGGIVSEKIREYVLLAVVLLAVFGVYLRTAFPAFKGNDSPETSAAAYTLGIQHEPGYPIHVMLGKIAVLIPLANPAFRVNLLSSLLAVLTLLVTYFILTRRIYPLFKIKKSPVIWGLGLGPVLILAFSRIFWGQAIDAKGGIYILNLFFLSLLTYLSLEQLRVSSPESRVKTNSPGTKNLYLIIYLYGLSLANHWPSMILMFPVFAAFFYIYRSEINEITAAKCLAALAVGISPYIFLYIRAGTNPWFCWGDPSTIDKLADFALRKIYAGQEMPFDPAAAVFRLKYLAGEMASNCGFLSLLALPGIYAVLKKFRAAGLFILTAFILTAGVLVVYNNSSTSQSTVWLMGVFLLPAQYMLFLFTAAGIAFITAAAAGSRINGVITAAVFAAGVSLALLNAAENDRHADYISYDLIHNLTVSAGGRSYYLAENDMYVMPMIYEKFVKKGSPGLKFFPVSFLAYDWGVRQAREIFGFFPARTNAVVYNLSRIALIAAGEKAMICRDFTSPAFDSLRLPYYQNYAGLLKCFSQNPFSDSSEIFRFYSYRGIYRKFAQTPENIEIVTRYLIFMSLHGERLMQLGRHREAIALFKKAMLIPAEKFEENICFRMAQSYGALGDNENALKNLENAVAANERFVPAYEFAGRIYSGINDTANAEKMFRLAKSYGSTDAAVTDFLRGITTTAGADE